MGARAVCQNLFSEIKTAQNQTQSRFFFARKVTEISGRFIAVGAA
jgi:hypothetical protein